jgi:DNA repair protein RecO (recombination protein O)
MRVDLEPAYILHSRPYRESSLLLEVLAREHGRTGLVARGARGARSRWKNMLQPFRPLLLSWSQRGELGTLTGADQVASPPALGGESLLCGLYANELLVRFLQRSDPHPGLFSEYRGLLAGLMAEEGLENALRLFEMNLLDAVGFGLQLDHEAGTAEALDPDAWYRYVPEAGPRRAEYSADKRSELISGSALLGLKSGATQAAHLPELKRLMRRVIRFYLGDKPLKSQALFY